MRTDGSPRAADAVAGGLIESIVPLQPSLRTDVALKRIHGELLQRIRQNDDGVREGRDGDYLHDFRVAVRRTRTGLRQLERVYPRRLADHFADDFKWLSKSTGTARDIEVYLASFERFRVDLGAAIVDDLGPLVDSLRRHQGIERTRCAEAIESDRYATLIRDWRDFLRRPTENNVEATDAGRPVNEVAAERIEAAFRRVVRRGSGLQEQSPADSFHRLRLDCKKLRYLLEFFSVVFPGDAGSQAIVALKRTQDALGAINDLRVQAEWVARFPGASGPAMRAFAAYLAERQQAERRAFLEPFATFIGEDSAAALQRFLRGGKAAR
jgi:CHAD domain-containing protein